MAMYPCLQGGGGGTTDALYEECKSKVMDDILHSTLTVYNSRVDNVTGGYVKTGRNVWLYVKCRATSSIDANGIYRNTNAPGGWSIFTGAPAAYSNAVRAGGSIQNTYCAISSSGGLSFVMDADSPGTTSSTKVYVVPVGEYFEIWAKYSSAS